MKRLDFIRSSLLALPFLFSSAKAATDSNEIFDPSDIRLHNNDPVQAIKKTGAAYFPPGIHELNSVVITDGRLFGPGTIRKSPKATEALTLKGAVLIEGLSFMSADDRRDGACEIRLGEALSHAIIKDCHFLGASYACIAADRNGKDDKSLRYKVTAANVKFINNEVGGEYSRHLYLHSVENILIQGNSFKKSKRDSIRLRQRCKKVQILSNNFENIGTLPVLEKPESADVVDSFWSGEEFIFSNNIIDGCALHCLDLKGIDTHNVLVTNNQIKNCGWHGISLMGDAKKNHPLKNVIINGNMISECNQLKRDPEAAAIMLSGPLKEISVSGNQLFRNLGRGLMLQNREDKKSINTDIIVTGNQIRDSKIGMVIYPCDGLILKDNISTKIITHDKDRSYKMARAIIQDNVN